MIETKRITSIEEFEAEYEIEFHRRVWMGDYLPPPKKGREGFQAHCLIFEQDLTEARRLFYYPPL